VKKPCLYLLCGLPFAGKTTLVKALEDWLEIRRVALDEINTERGIWNNETAYETLPSSTMRTPR